MNELAQFESFVRNYQDMVFTTAWRLSGNETDAEDIAQEVFLKAHQHFAELCSNPAAGGWLKTTTRNLCLNHLTRYRNRWRFFSEMDSRAGLENEESAGFEATLAAPDTWEQDQLNASQRQLLEAALLKLPADQRVALVLYHFDGLRYEEIAEQLKISVGKVKTDIHRGREALRVKMERLLAAEPEVRSA